VRWRPWAIVGAIVLVVAAGIALVLVLGGDDSPDAQPAATVPPSATTTAGPTTTVASTAAPTTAAAATAAPTTSATTAAPTTVPEPLGAPDALAGRYVIDAIVTGDTLAPERVGQPAPFPPLTLTPSCTGTMCTVADSFFGPATVDGDTVAFAFGNPTGCVLAASAELTIVERDAAGVVQMMEGTATFDWSGNCPAFVEQFALTATRQP
jgi:hypothetical protein